MKRLQLITSNSNKTAEYERIAQSLGWHGEFVLHPMDIPERQSNDPLDVLRSKMAFVKTKTCAPFLVDDAVFLTERYKNFPGTNAKFINASLGMDGWKRLFNEGDRITAIATIGLSYLGQDYFFEGRLDGVLSFRSNTTVNPAAPINSIFFVPNEGAFLANLVTNDRFENHRKRALAKLVAFLKECDEHEHEALNDAAKRWDERAETWSDDVQDARCYVNHEDGYARFAKAIEQFLPTISGRALDIGCGDGAIARLLAQNSKCQVTGIDVSANMIEEAKRSSAPNLSFIHATLDALPIEQKFNFIASRGIVLSHLPFTAVFDFLEDATMRTADGATFIFDFLQNANNGNFPPHHPLNVFSLTVIRDWMRELGWTLVFADGTDKRRVRIAALHKPAPGTIYFATGNPHKAEELRRAMQALGHMRRPIAFCGLDVDEIKSDDLQKIVVDKLKRSYGEIQEAVLATDGGIFIKALGGFPGANSKQAARTLGADGLLKLLRGHRNRRAIRRNCIGFFDGKQVKTFTSEIICEISTETRGMFPSYELDKILIPITDKNPQRLTYAEMPIKERVALTELPELAKFVRAL